MNTLKNTILCSLLFVSFATHAQVLDNQCGKDMIESLKPLVAEQVKSESPSLPYDLYQKIDSILICFLEGGIDHSQLESARDILMALEKKAVPLLVGNIDGLKFWHEDETISLLGTQMVKELPYILNQLNSSIIVLTPTELENRQTKYNFESDLNLEFFNPWDRRNCLELVLEEIASLESQKSEPRILDDPIASHSYIVLEHEAIKIDTTKSCLYNSKTNELNCDTAKHIAETVIHENAHLVENRFPNFYKYFHTLPGGRDDRLTKAKEVVPGYGTTVCTYLGYTDICERAIQPHETQLILDATSVHQTDGGKIGLYYTFEKGDRPSCGEKNLQVTKDGIDYCVWIQDSLYALDRAEEYFPTMVEVFYKDKEHFLNTSTKKEQEALSALFYILGQD